MDKSVPASIEALQYIAVHSNATIPCLAQGEMKKMRRRDEEDEKER